MSGSSSLCAAVAAVLVLSSCTVGGPGTGGPPGGVGIVVGAHANAAAPTLSEGIRDRVRAVVESRGTAALVSADGQPAVVESGAFDLACQNAAACDVEITNQLDGLDRAVGEVRADTPENDLLGAMALGADSVRGQPGDTTLVVIDSGLSTAGALRFQEPGVLDADPTELADFLDGAGELPDLAGMTVVFRGLGDVAPPQESLTVPRRTALREIWTELATRAGASSVQVETDPLTEPPATGLPEVTAVAAQRSSGLECFGTLREADVAFQPDAATLVDTAAAASTLTPMAACLGDLGRDVLVTGTTASAGTDEGRRVLSEQRAETIATLLVELGAPTERITARGLGFQVPPCVPDRDADGTLLPGPAAQNRQVIVEPADG